MSIGNVPDFRLSLGNQDLRGTLYGEAAELLDITAKVRPRLNALSLTEKRGEEADQLDLVLDDSDRKLALPRAGAILHLALGWKRGSDVVPGLVDKGSFVVDTVEHSGPPDTVRITAHSADFTGNLKQRREASWHDTTLGAIVREIASRHGLTARCAPALAGLAVKALAQSRESDMALLRRLGREHDAVATVKRGALILAPVGAGTTTSGKALPAVTIRRRDGDRHSYRVEKREEAAGVTASWHDRKGAKKQTVTVGEAEGARHLSRTYGSASEARAAASAAKARADRRPSSLDLTPALGRPDLAPEQRVSVKGYKAEIDATEWLIAEVRHDLTDRGYVTTLKLESA